jgi:hypothetical protein
MNIIFHTLASLSTAAVLGSRWQALNSNRLFMPSDFPFLAGGFITGIFMHGLLDYIPHAYPIKSAVDVTVSLGFFFAMLFFVKRRLWFLLIACFFGGIFPDLVDLGPGIINNFLGWSLPTIKFFPWHWKEYSGSIYDGSRSTESLLYHLIVIGISAGLLYAFRRDLLGVAKNVS